MQRRTLGNTGLSVSPLCIGMWQLAGPVAFDGKPDGYPDPGRDRVLRMIRSLHDRGVNFIDAAEQYGDGEGERRVGEAIHGDRDAWVVSTKFGCRVGQGGKRIDDASPDTILPSLEGSLRRLGTDRVDIFLYHWPPNRDDLPKAARVLERARDAGKARFFGVSTHDPGVIRLLIDHGLLDVLQCPANLVGPNEDARRLAVDRNAGLQLRGVMARGLLSGKYFDRPPEFGGEDIRSHLHAGERFERYAVLRDALPPGVNMPEAAYRWALGQPGAPSVCVGARSLDDYEDALAAADAGPLSGPQAAALEAAGQRLAGG